MHSQPLALVRLAMPAIRISVLVLVLCSLAAADTLYTTQASFAAATTATTTADLSPYTPAGGANLYSSLIVAGADPFTVAATPDSSTGYIAVVSATFPGCCNTGADTLFAYPSSLGFPPGPGLPFTFSSPITALSWIAGRGCVSPTFEGCIPYRGEIYVTIGGNTYTFSGGSGSTPAFGGITTDAAFTTVTFTTDGNDYLELSNITYVQAVPEPSSMLLLSSGLAVWARRKKMRM